MAELTKLFQPIRVGTLEIKNRIVMAGFAMTSAEDTSKIGVVHEKYIDFFEERARGGAGLIILPDTSVDRNMRSQSHPCIGGDEFNPGLSALTEAVHMWGAKIAPDLVLSGWRSGEHRHSAFPFGNDWRPLSTFPLFSRDQRSVDMTLGQIQETEELFADAASRAKVTGFDAIHLAGHFGFLIGQFLSPYFNKRTDKYGGSLENRMRFALEIIHKPRNTAFLLVIIPLSAWS